ncbi:DUF4011 domain-containing protein [Halocatena halophila]|uniref:DUF4011 domain-containing protein n=1 Tax=Halocatena halophila TaxID=2814576 RepID=UPI002ED05022
MVRNIDDLADDRTQNLKSAGEKFHDSFLIDRPKTEWATYIDEIAKDLSANIQISDLNLSKTNFGRELGPYYRRGVKTTTGTHTDVPSVLENVSDRTIGGLVYELNDLSYRLTTANLDIADVQTATGAVIEKLLLKHGGRSLTVTGGTVADVTTRLFGDDGVISVIDRIVDGIDLSDTAELRALIDEPQMMVPLWDHQRTALAAWCENDGRGYVDMATATGKTVLGLGTIALAYGELHPTDQTADSLQVDIEGTDVLVVAHNELLLEQWRRLFATHLNVPLERIAANDATLAWGTIHFRTPQGLLDSPRSDDDIVLLDEAHHYATTSGWGSLLESFSGNVLALSGSVGTAGDDSNALTTRLSDGVGPELGRYTVAEARADGIIPSFDWEVQYAPYELVGTSLETLTDRVTSAFKTVQSTLEREDIDGTPDTPLRTFDDVRQFSHTNAGNELKRNDETFRNLVTGLFSRQTKRWNLTPSLDAIVDLVVEHADSENVVVLADSNAGVEALETRLQDVLSDPESVFLVTSAQSGDEQRTVIDAFDTPASNNVLLGTGDLLGEGIDMQHASVAINMATGGVNPALVQRIGRVLRNPADTTKHATFYNVVGVPPTREAAVPREDGKRLIEHAAAFCALGDRFERLPGFSMADGLDPDLFESLLTDGSAFIDLLERDPAASWEVTPDRRAHLSAFKKACETDTADATAMLGAWTEYTWQHDGRDTTDTTNDGETAIEGPIPNALEATAVPQQIIQRVTGTIEEEIRALKQVVADHPPDEIETPQDQGNPLQELHEEALTIIADAIDDDPAKLLTREVIIDHAAQTAPRVAEFFENVNTETPTEPEPPDAQPADDQPTATDDQARSPLAEHYECFRLFQTAVQYVVTHRGLQEEDTQSQPIVAWQSDLEALVYGDGLDGATTGYGDQQRDRTDFTISSYRELFGDGNNVTEFQCIDTVPLTEDDLAGIDTAQLPASPVRPIAPESSEPLPITVDTADELAAARSLLAEFPSEPAVDVASETEPPTNEDTTERFWDEAVTPISEVTPNRPQSAPDTGDDAVTALIEEAQSQLLDLSRRNDLISFEPSDTQLVFEDARPIPVARALESDGELWIGNSTTETGDGSSDVIVDAAHSSGLIDENVARALPTIERATKRHRRERGVESLYLALGQLCWVPNGNATETRSPLFLVPVDLSRSDSQEHSTVEFVIETRGCGLQLNPALRKKLATTHDVELPTDEALSLSVIDAAFESVFQALSSVTDVSIEPTVVLGCFDSSKFSLYTDLERNRALIADNPVVQALAGNQSPLLSAHESIDPPAVAELDDTVDPADTFQVLDADSSQQAAIEAAKRGTNFVLQGPPGTGKSQTIANIIAEKLAAGERVLFVSEKQAALDVVKRRLEEVGLDQFCLEVHGKRANREQVLETLEAALTTAKAEPKVDRESAIERLSEHRAAINAYGDQLGFAPEGWDLTVYEVFGIRSGRSSAPRIDIGDVEPLAVSQSAVTTAIDALATLARYDEEIERYETNPWRHTRLTEWGVETGTKAQRALETLSETIKEMDAVRESIAAAIGLEVETVDTLRTVDDLLAHLDDRPQLPWRDTLFDEAFVTDGSRLKALATLERARKSQTRELEANYRRSFFALDGIELTDELAAFGSLRSVNPTYRSLKRTITNHARDGYEPDHEQLLDDTRQLAEIQRIEAEREEYRDVIDRLGPLYAGADTDWETLIQAQQWIAGLEAFDDELIVPVRDRLFDDRLADVKTIRQRTDELLKRFETAYATFDTMMDTSEIRIDGEKIHNAPFSSVQSYFEGRRDDVPALQQRITFEAQLETVRETVCADYVDRFLEGSYDPDELVRAFEKGFYTDWLHGVYEQTDLGGFSVAELERYIESFRALDTEQLELARAAIRRRVRDRQPTFDERHTPGEEEVILRQQIDQQSEPLRSLFDAAGSFITTLTPCFMMSPLSVAQYCPSSSIKFDTVIFDEASQIKPHDAVSSIARAEQAIIVGDRKQLPPTSFFTAESATDDAVREDSPSILEEATTVLPERTLRWHYRSNAEELIAFSNEQFYDGRLQTFPENEPTDSTGVTFEYVEDGVYDRGGTRQNRPEAVRVVDCIEAHAQTRPEASLGVVAFSSAQQRAIQDELDRRRASNSTLDSFVASDDVLNEFFIKNLEVVQGDERDRLLFSVGYGPDKNGQLSMNFGPLNEAGGERRLNVAITRAKSQVTVVSSILPEEIDCSRTDSKGVELFKRYLTYAREESENGGLKHTDGDSTDLFVASVETALKNEGYTVVRPADRTGYSVDLAIVHPERPGSYVLGIECDGVAYRHSNTARDRDRLRREVLEELGWTVHRVWSPNWTTNRELALDRLTTAIDEAIESS